MTQHGRCVLHLRVGLPCQMWSQEMTAVNCAVQKTADESTLQISFKRKTMLLKFTRLPTCRRSYSLFTLAKLCSYVNVSPTKCKRQRGVRCRAGGPGGQGPAGAAVRIRAQDYRITRRTTWTGRWQERRGEGGWALPRVLKHKEERTREKIIFSHDAKRSIEFLNHRTHLAFSLCFVGVGVIRV